MRAWYLHNSSDGRLFFKNQQNLAAKLRSTAQSLHPESVERMLRNSIEDQFAPNLKDCFQQVKALAPLDEVKLELDKTTLTTRSQEAAINCQFRVIGRHGGSNNSLKIVLFSSVARGILFKSS